MIFCDTYTIFGLKRYIDDEKVVGGGGGDSIDFKDIILQVQASAKNSALLLSLSSLLTLSKSDIKKYDDYM